MGCANCMVTNTSAVNGNVNSYRNAPDNLNCIWLNHLTTEQSILANCVICCTAGGMTQIVWFVVANVFIFNPSMMFLFLYVGIPLPLEEVFVQFYVVSFFIISTACLVVYPDTCRVSML